MLFAVMQAIFILNGSIQSHNRYRRLYVVYFEVILNCTESYNWKKTKDMLTWKLNGKSHAGIISAVVIKMKNGATSQVTM